MNWGIIAYEYVNMDLFKWQETGIIQDIFPKDGKRSDCYWLGKNLNGIFQLFFCDQEQALSRSSLLTTASLQALQRTEIGEENCCFISFLASCFSWHVCANANGSQNWQWTVFERTFYLYNSENKNFSSLKHFNS